MRIDRILKNNVSCKKLIICLLTILAVWLMLFLNVDLDLKMKDSFIYDIAQKVVTNRMPIAIILALAGIMGLFYKNKSAYYSLFFNIELVLGSIVLISQNIITPFNPNCCLSYIITTSIFSISFIGIYCIKDKLFFKGNQKQHNNPLEPINEAEKLFPSRRYQMNELISIIKSHESDNGYTICVSSDWGSGKTSFINAVLDEIKTNKNLDCKIEEIRINAMALDGTESLLNYLFGRIKEILKANGIYVGINSEYQELIVSFLETATHEKMGSFIRKRFSSTSDCRENLSKLSRLLEEELEEKIIIVIDDLERCKEDKILEFLYFIKEISVLHKCVIIFLTDYNKLIDKNSDYFTDEFLEKFFNYRFNLQPVSDYEIITNSINDKVFIKLLEDIKKIYEDKIENVSSRSYFGTEDPAENEKRKEEEITSIKNDYQFFVDQIQNPRRLKKIYNKYKLLLKTAETQALLWCKEYLFFIKKVDYKKQILILSLLYVLLPNQYEKIETKGIMEFNSIFISNDGKNSDEKFLNLVLINEWKLLLPSYIAKEKIRFMNCLISNPNELAKVANGFTSLEEEYVSCINNGEKPINITATDVLIQLFRAQFKNKKERINCIIKAIELYFEKTSFDEVITSISNNSIVRYLSVEDETLYSLCDMMLNLNILNKEQCLNEYSSFVEHYLFFKINYLTRFLSLLFSEDVDYEIINKTILNAKGLDDTIKRYYKSVTKYFKLKLEQDEQNITVKDLKHIVENVKNYCKDHNILDCLDVKNLYEQAEKSIKCIEYLSRLQDYINSFESIDSQITKTNSLSSNENYSEALAYLVRKLESYDDSIEMSFQNKSMQSLWDDIDNLFRHMVANCKSISKEDLDNANTIIEVFFEKFQESPTSWRQLYIQMKKTVLKCEAEESDK